MGSINLHFAYLLIVLFSDPQLLAITARSIPATNERYNFHQMLKITSSNHKKPTAAIIQRLRHAFARISSTHVANSVVAVINAAGGTCFNSTYIFVRRLSAEWHSQSEREN